MQGVLQVWAVGPGSFSGMVGLWLDFARSGLPSSRSPMADTLVTPSWSNQFDLLKRIATMAASRSVFAWINPSLPALALHKPALLLVLLSNVVFQLFDEVTSSCAKYCAASAPTKPAILVVALVGALLAGGP